MLFHVLYFPEIWWMSLKWVCGGGEEEISHSVSSLEEQPLTLHFPQDCWEYSRTPGRMTAVSQGDIITQRDVRWMGMDPGNNESEYCLSCSYYYLESHIEKKWPSASTLAKSKEDNSFCCPLSLCICCMVVLYQGVIGPRLVFSLSH